MSEIDDERMRQCAQQDNRAAFADIVRAHQERLVRYAARMLGGDADGAADIVQDAFVALWQGRRTYERQGRLRAYLLRVVRNRCLDDRRSQPRRSTIPLGEGDEPPCSPAQRNVTLAEDVREAVMALPEPARSVFLLSEYEGLSYAEIAETLGCPEGTVASRKHMAVARLQRALAPWYGGGGSAKGGATK